MKTIERTRLKLRRIIGVLNHEYVNGNHNGIQKSQLASAIDEIENAELWLQKIREEHKKKSILKRVLIKKAEE